MRIARLCILVVLFASALPLSASSSTGGPLITTALTADPLLATVPPGEPASKPLLVDLYSPGPTSAADAMIGEVKDLGAVRVLPTVLGELSAEPQTANQRDEVLAIRPIAQTDSRWKTVLPPLAKVETLTAVNDALPVALKAPAPEKSLLTARLVTEPLNETMVREELKASRSVAPLEPAKISATQINGQVIAEPLTLIVSLKDQRLDVYRGLERVETTRVSSGKAGYQTLTGVFGILQKKPEHYSNLYDNAPMPWMQRLTRSGTAIHAGVVPNYPASHGCVRTPENFAPKLFRMTEIGGKVAMLTGAMVVPKRINHNTLVMPASLNEVGDRMEKRVVGGVRESALAAALSPDAGEFGAATDRAGAATHDERPWHILVTRREQRDIAIGVQDALAAMGYLEPQEQFVGYVGNSTRKAIRAFEKDHDLRQRGVFNESIAAKIYEAAGKGPLPDAYLFLRRGFSRVRHVPVQLREPKQPLGTHLFTYVYPSNGDEPGWVGISLEGDHSRKVLDRITIPDDMRDQIAKGLTSGASLIVADVGKHSSVVPEGDDFIVRTNDSAKSNVVAEKAKAKKRKRASTRRATTPKKRVVRAKPQRKKVRRTVSGPRGFRIFGRR